MSKNRNGINIIDIKYEGKSREGNYAFDLSIHNESGNNIPRVQVPVLLKNRPFLIFRDQTLCFLDVKEGLKKDEERKVRFYVHPSGNVRNIEIFPAMNGETQKARKPLAVIKKQRGVWNPSLLPG